MSPRLGTMGTTEMQFVFSLGRLGRRGAPPAKPQAEHQQAKAEQHETGPAHKSGAKQPQFAFEVLRSSVMRHLPPGSQRTVLVPVWRATLRRQQHKGGQRPHSGLEHRRQHDGPAREAVAPDNMRTSTTAWRATNSGITCKACDRPL